MDEARRTFTDEEALKFHSSGKPGKLEVTPTKPMATQHDLSLAYSPGVAVPVVKIAEDPACAYDYTAKGNMVAVISNGTAILGLGDLGALASKPVMEGKSVLFKRFADIDSIDLEVDTSDVDAFINCVRYLGPAFAGINLEDIKAPDSFVIEERLREVMDIPVFHDDQHGTAIIAAAALLNALDLAGKKIEDAQVVVNGAGSSALAVIGLIKAMGLPQENAIVCDRKGVIYRGRTEGVDQFRSAHAVDTDKRTLTEAMEGADVFIGLSVGGVVSKEMVRSMAKNPIIFAMANPDPEIRPEDVEDVRGDAIMATGRSDYPNQVNNVLGFPYIFRGAIDVHATTINEEMKIACARALAKLAREDVPDEVAAAYGKRLVYGPNYIIPTPFDPRLISAVAPAVAEAAMTSGVARKPIEDLDAYAHTLDARLDPTASFLQQIYGSVRAEQKRVVFAEGEDEAVIRAACAFQNEGLGKAILIGREEPIRELIASIGVDPSGEMEIHNARVSTYNPDYTDHLYRRLQRQGYLFRDVQRLVNNDRNVFSACMVALGHADAMVSGVTRNFDTVLNAVKLVIPERRGEKVIGMSVILSKGRTIFMADTNVTELPESDEIADIAVQAAHAARQLGHTPRVAFLSYSNFGWPSTPYSKRLSDAVEILDGRRDVDFEYEGEMSPNVALDEEAAKSFPFSRLSGPANVLIVPGIHTGSISTKLLSVLGGATVIGPLVIGLEKSIQITQLGAKTSEIVTMAAMAAHDLDREHRSWAELARVAANG
ncbi:MAG: NADP-dependent malic enzyme [Pseudomonadota bacterium]